MLGPGAVKGHKTEKGSPVTRRPTTTAKRTCDLIQHRAGVELPACGTWTIASGQPISARRRGALRTEEITFHTTHGALTVSTDLAAVTLEIGLLAHEVGIKGPLSIGLAGDLSSADRVGRWRFDGTMTIDGAASPFELALDYQGVHARGAAPVAWLTISQGLTIPAPDGRSRRRRSRGLHISGDLNAHRDTGARRPAEAAIPADRPVPPKRIVVTAPAGGYR